MHDSISHDRPVGAVMTPLRWAKWLVQQGDFVSKWVDGATICDPTAGRGVFAFALIDAARELGVDLNEKMFSRLFLIEREADFLRSFHDSFRQKYNLPFPSKNTICADIILDNPRQRFDLLVGNPPWENFNDLPVDYKDRLKHAFVANGLVEDRQLLLLGCSRVDISALVVAVAMKENLATRGEAAFFVPLSLFQGEGAHSGFRRYSLGNTVYRPTKIWDFAVSEVFDRVATRYGAVHLARDASVEYPIPYFVETKSGWDSRLAGPVGDGNAPLSVFDTTDRFAETSCAAMIEVRENQKPRQGLNTCGANDVYIFGDRPLDLPGEYLFPLLTKECFRDENPQPKKHVLLPYEQRTGKPLDADSLRSCASLSAYFTSKKDLLLARKGTLLNTWMKRGIWWACLGVGEYSFAPFKVVWEAYGKSNFSPRVFGSFNGMPWQPNQAMHAYIPCSSEDQAEDLRDRLMGSNIEAYLRSLNVEGTCNWAQPGRIKRFLRFIPERAEQALELQL